jgi:hypothetical protein
VIVLYQDLALNGCFLEREEEGEEKEERKEEGINHLTAVEGILPDPLEREGKGRTRADGGIQEEGKERQNLQGGRVWSWC